MTYTDIFYLGPEHIVSGYHGDYRLSPGRITVESWMAEILFDHGYCLSLKQEKGVESYERKYKKCNRKGRAGHKENIQKGGELKWRI